jgi:hypothetical protein
MTHLQWVELTPSYRCNNACLGCFASSPDAGDAMSDRESLDALTAGRRDGATGLWLGGGEPTLSRATLRLAHAARRLGYARVKLQTNGMMLAYPEYARRCRDAGVTEVAFAIKGATAATHDRLTRTEGCFDLLRKGIENCRALGLDLEGDVLVYRSNAHELPATVADHYALGLRRFRVWLLSATGAAREDPAVRAEVPRIADVMPRLTEAADQLPPDAPGDVLVSLHTPPCTVPATHPGLRFFAPALGLRVVNPGGHAFMLEDSPMEGGAFLPDCAGCALRPRCNGPRQEYIDRFGPREFVPLATHRPL